MKKYGYYYRNLKKLIGNTIPYVLDLLIDSGKGLFSIIENSISGNYEIENIIGDRNGIQHEGYTKTTNGTDNRLPITGCKIKSTSFIVLQGAFKGTSNQTFGVSETNRNLQIGIYSGQWYLNYGNSDTIGGTANELINTYIVLNGYLWAIDGQIDISSFAYISNIIETVPPTLDTEGAFTGDGTLDFYLGGVNGASLFAGVEHFAFVKGDYVTGLIENALIFESDNDDYDIDLITENIMTWQGIVAGISTSNVNKKLFDGVSPGPAIDKYGYSAGGFFGKRNLIQIPNTTIGISKINFYLSVSTSDNTGALLTGNNNAFSYYLGIMTKDSTSTIISNNATLISIHIDGVLFTGTTRGHLYDAIVDGKKHLISIIANISTWNNIQPAYYQGAADIDLQCMLFDIYIDDNNDGIPNHYYKGFGVSQEYWNDQIGSNDCTIITPCTPIIVPPKLETDLVFSKTLDAQGRPLENIGEVKRNIKIKNSSIGLFNGTDNSITFSDLTGITIADYIGTSTPSISGNIINFTAGTCFYLELSNGSYYYFREGRGNFLGDEANDLHGTINGVLASFWDGDDLQYPINLIEGYKKYVNDADPTLIIKIKPTLSPVISGYTYAEPIEGLKMNNYVNKFDFSGGVDTPTFNSFAVGQPNDLTNYEQGEALINPVYDRVYEDYVYKCTSAGVMNTKATQAYGTLEFSIYKGADGNISNVIISDIDSLAGDNSYTASINADEGISFIKRVNGTPTVLFSTIASYIDIETEYSIKGVRNETENQLFDGEVGEWLWLIKGGSFGDQYQVIEATTGTNPIIDNTHTSFNYLNFDLDSGDYIKNVRFSNYDFNPLEFIVDTGSYVLSTKYQDRILVYASERTTDEDTKVRKYEKIVGGAIGDLFEPLLDSEGAPILDSEDSPILVLR